MSDYVVRGGLFEASCARLLSTSFRVTWVDRYPPRSTVRNAVGHQVIDAGAEDDEDDGDDAIVLEELGVVVADDDSKSKRYQRKYRCEEHDLNVWGKPKLAIACGHCLKPLQELSL